MMNYCCSIEDTRYLQAFIKADICAEEFHHREHLRLAYTLLVVHDFDTAYRRLKSGILNLLVHIGADCSKYHETLTRAWLLAVHHFMVKSERSTGFDAFIDDNALLLDTKIMLTHYSESLLYSDSARKSYQQPDIDPIPTHNHLLEVPFGVIR